MNKLKKVVFSLIIFFLFIFLILFPNYTKKSIIETSILWFDKIIPTIPVSYFFGNLLLYYNNILYFPYKFILKLVNFENFHSFTLFIISIIVGNPTSTILIVNSYNDKLITKDETIRLLSFSSFVSIFFILFVFNINYSIPIILGQYIASFILSCIKKVKKIESCNVSNFDLSILISKLPNQLLSIYSTMIFVTLIKLPFSLINNKSIFLLPTIMSMFEITSGINVILNLYQGVPLIYFSSILLSFHGIAILLQVISILKIKKLSTSEYLKNRLIHSVISSILSIIFYLFFKLCI